MKNEKKNRRMKKQTDRLTSGEMEKIQNCRMKRETEKHAETKKIYMDKKKI